MLLPLIANNQNVVPASLPLVKIDRGGGGRRWPGYEIVDISAAIALFPEIAGEDAVSRAVRRARWLDEALPAIRDARERQRAAAFLAGIQVGQFAQLEEFEARTASAEARARAAEARAAAARPSGLGTALAVVGAIAIVALLFRARSKG